MHVPNPAAREGAYEILSGIFATEGFPVVPPGDTLRRRRCANGNDGTAGNGWRGGDPSAPLGIFRLYPRGVLSPRFSLRRDCFRASIVIDPPLLYLLRR